MALDVMLPGEDNEPVLLHRAMRYAVFAGGKRIRPILAFASAEIAGSEGHYVLPFAVAVECVHTYSLIHDDLPAMDDDDLRRGKPAAHKVFGEAMAILAGDALLSFAFEVLTSPKSIRTFRPDRLLTAVGQLAAASGSRGLIAGQVLDIASEGKPVEADTVDRIICNKTGALIRASLTCGARLAGGTQEQVRILGEFGECLGKAFQIRDDLLDLEGDPAKLGKKVKKDRQRGKATYPRLIGAERSKDIVKSLIEHARETVRPLGERASILGLIAEYVGRRIN
jgi:geranylgeranyl diphosphate synthase type II